LTERLFFPHRSFAAFLFDMDGTILSSIAAAERVWAKWARGHGLDVDALMAIIHGVRSVDTIRRLALPGVDPEAEAAVLTLMEIQDVAGIDPIAGAAAFLASLPAERWAIVTSAPRALAERRLQAAGLPVPAVMVTSEDVENGKPAPDCFLLAAQRLGHPIEECLVFEDAPAGIAAAEAAGASLMVITAMHSHLVETRHNRVANYDEVALRIAPSGRLELAAAA
jgi:sugar-phosphatase